MSVDWKKRCAEEKCKARSYEKGLRMAFVLASVIVSLIVEMNFGCAKKTAGVVNFTGGDWKRGIYWLAAAVLTATVTF